MANFILLFSWLFLTGIVPLENIYTYSVTTIEGNNQALSAFEGKKILIITLPLEQNSSSDSLLYSLDSIATLYGSSLAIIGAPSYEDGYNASLKNSLAQWYRSKLGDSIIITDGLYTRKTSGSQQHPLFKWLTNKDKNGHFNNDVEGANAKFLVWTDGELAGVFSTKLKIGSRALSELLEEE